MKNNVNVGEKLSELVEKIDPQNRYYIFAGLLVFVFLIDYFLLMRPQLGSLAKINPQIKILQDDLKKAKTDIQRLGQYKQQVEELRAKVKESGDKVISREAVSLVLERISSIANKNSIKIEQISPKPEDQHKLLTGNDRVYYSLPIVVDARADYHSFGKFLNQLEADKIFFVVDGFSLSSNPNSSSHAIKLVLSSIVFDDVKPKEKEKK